MHTPNDQIAAYVRESFEKLEAKASDCADKIPLDILTAFSPDKSKEARADFGHYSAIARQGMRRTQEEAALAAMIGEQLDSEMPADVIPEQEDLAGDALEVSDNSAAAERAAQIAIEESGDKLWK